MSALGHSWWKIDVRVIIATVALIAMVAIAPLALFATSEDAEVIHACAGQEHVRLVDSTEDCKINETHVSWNMQGPQGIQGVDGVDGTGGLACWDISGDGIAQTEEDTNGDGAVDVWDCRADLPTPTPQPTPELLHRITLVSSDAANNDQFGSAVAISNNTIIVGAKGERGNSVPGNANQGSAYIFVLTPSGWTEQAKLVAADGAFGDQFGHSVAIDGNFAAVGAILANANGTWAGAVYIFERVGEEWSEVAKVVPPEVEAGDRFGISVAVTGTTVLAGTQQGGEFGRGWVHAFDRTAAGWIYTQHIEPLDADRDNNFGNSLAAYGDRMVVSAPNDASYGSSAGSAYVFRRIDGIWEQESKISPMTPVSAESLGVSIDISDQKILASGRTSAKVGRVNAFSSSDASWTATQSFTASDGEYLDRFGGGIGLDGSLSVIGAHTDNDLGENSGSIYLFSNQTGVWTETAKITRPSGDAGELFGWDVDVDAGWVVVSAPQAGSGVVELYEVLNFPDH